MLHGKILPEVQAHDKRISAVGHILARPGRHRMGMNYQDSHISLKFQNNTASQVLYLLDVGFDLYAKLGH